MYRFCFPTNQRGKNSNSCTQFFTVQCALSVGGETYIFKDYRMGFYQITLMAEGLLLLQFFVFQKLSFLRYENIYIFFYSCAVW